MHRLASESVFRYGEIALKPLVLRDVADELELHESTISRARATSTCPRHEAFSSSSTFSRAN
ncbi:MAG: RNA polymerase sigma-54 factor RpoN [uncultured Caballeronia sp.]|nr:MAG: RNA polymerase sigma-54 factor RpoN [uncultured Caballeronia sp.]